MFFFGFLCLFLEDINPEHYCATDNPILVFWWSMPWNSKPEGTIKGLFTPNDVLTIMDTVMG